jgi:hypothetical protein
MVKKLRNPVYLEHAGFYGGLSQCGMSRESAAMLRCGEAIDLFVKNTIFGHAAPQQARGGGERGKNHDCQE